jgi:hypothetical protein
MVEEKSKQVASKTRVENNNGLFKGTIPEFAFIA